MQPNTPSKDALFLPKPSCIPSQESQAFYKEIPNSYHRNPHEHFQKPRATYLKIPLEDPKP